MSFFIVTLFAIALFVAVATTHNKLAKYFILAIGLYWLAIAYISCTNPFELYDVSITSYVYIVSGYIMILMGYLTYKPQRIKKYFKFSHLEHDLDLICENKLLMLIFVVSFGVMIYLASTQWKLILFQSGMGNLKLDFFELVFNNNHLLFFLYQSLISPIFYICCLLLCYMILLQKWNRYLLFVGLYVLLFCFIGGKRGYFAIVFVYLLSVFIISRYTRFYTGVKKKLPLKGFALIGILAFLGATAMTAVSGGGTGAGKDEFKEASNDILANTIVYRVGPYRAFDKFVQSDVIESSGGYLFGRATLGGAIDYYGTSIMNWIGVSVKSARATAMVPIQDNSVQIGRDGRGWNFAYTGFYYFYYDLGYIGILLFSFLFGLFIRFSISLFERFGTIGSMALVCYVFHACILMTGSWFNMQLYAQPAILICLLIHNYEINKIRKYEVYKKGKNVI